MAVDLSNPGQNAQQAAGLAGKRLRLPRRVLLKRPAHGHRAP